MSIGTAKPNLEEMEGIKHYMINSHSIQEELSAATFAKEAQIILHEEFKKHNEIVLVGGSGMFIDALCFGLDDIPHSQDLRKEITKEFQQSGINPLLDELKKMDPFYYAKVDKNNPSRVIRAIEVIRLTGRPYSIQRTSKKKQQEFEIFYFVIQHDRNILYDRINQRVDLMIQKGLEEEARNLFPYRNLNSLQTVGYREFFQFFNDEISREETIAFIKQNTRRYAKRQETWFRRNREARWIPFKSTDKMIDEILQSISRKL